jgi:hypothetical protein
MLAALVEGPFESPERTVFSSNQQENACDHFRNGQNFFSFWVFFRAYNPWQPNRNVIQAAIRDMVFA